MQDASSMGLSVCVSVRPSVCHFFTNLWSIRLWRHHVSHLASLSLAVLFVPKRGGFGHFREIASSDFAYFPYVIRQEWYIADPGGSNHQKKNISVFYSLLKKLVFKSFLYPNSFSWILLISFQSWWKLRSGSWKTLWWGEGGWVFQDCEIQNFENFFNHGEVILVHAWKFFDWLEIPP